MYGGLFERLSLSVVIEREGVGDASGHCVGCPSCHDDGIGQWIGRAPWHVVTLVSVTAARHARRGGRCVGRRIESRVEIEASLETLIG